MKMNKKIMSVVLGLTITMSSVGLVNATINNSNPQTTVQEKQIATQVTTQTQAASVNDLYQQMVKIDQQMMQNITPEQMLAMEKAWMEAIQKGDINNFSDLYQQMINIDQQMMNNMTLEQMQAMYNNWLQLAKDKKIIVPNQFYQQMINNMTPEQMVEMDRQWMRSQQSNIPTQRSTRSPRNSGWNNSCGW